MRHDDNLHQNLRRHKGSASAHRCIGCGGQGYDWAFQHTGPADNPENYAPMCRSCHRKLDYSKGTPIPSTLARTTFEQRAKGGRNTWKNRERRGMVLYLPGRRTPWRASLQHNGARKTEHYGTREEAERALNRMLHEAGLTTPDRKG